MARKVSKSEKNKSPLDMIDDTKSSVVVNEMLHPYGKFGLVNYTDAERQNLTEADIFRYEFLPPTKLTTDIVVEAQKKNMFAIYNSTWRMRYPNGVGLTKTSVTDYDFLRRGVEATYFDKLLVSFIEHEKMWVKNYQKIFAKLTYEFERMATSFRTCKHIIAFRNGMEFKPEYAPIIMAMWHMFDLPINKSCYNISFRFYIFTSSIPGTKPSEKLAFLNSLPKGFTKMICLIADDMGLKSLKVFSEKTGCLGTFVPSLVKDDKGNFITHKYQPYVDLLDTNRIPGGGIYPPVIFIKKGSVKDKVIKYYSQVTNIVLF